MFTDSSDVNMVSAGILVKTGRKWLAQEGISRAEAQQRYKTLVGIVATGRAGPTHGKEMPT